MAVNQELANLKVGSIAINAKWLDFSCFLVNGKILAPEHPRIQQCFQQLAQYNRAELIRVSQDSICITKSASKTLTETPYNRIESIGFHGPSAVGIDGKGVTLKDMSILVNIDYKYYLTDLDGVSLVEQRNDVIDFLDIVLQFDDLYVQLTGAYDYLTETQ